MSKRKMSLLSSFENISPQVISRVGKEIQDLQRNPPDGIRFLPQEEDSIAEIHAEIKGPVGTPYDGGSFHIKLVLSNDFPHSPPRGFFLTKIYHPNVATNGDICVNTLKRDWTASVTLTHVLQVIRCLLIVPFPESSLNDEAGRLFMDSYAEYARRVKVWVSVHASKSLTREGAEAGSSAECKGGEKASSQIAGVTAKDETVTTSPSLGSKTASKVPTANREAVDVPPQKGAFDAGAPPASKRRDEAPRKTVKDRQKEAKKKGLKRL